MNNIKRTPIFIPEVHKPAFSEPYGYIYLTTDSLQNSERYFGVKGYVGKKEKSEFDHKYFGSGTLLVRAFKKRPQDFTCRPIDWANNKEELNKKEIHWIEFLGCVEDSSWYNIMSGGDGGKLSGESFERMRKSMTGVNHPFYGKRHSETTKQKISTTKTGTPINLVHTEEHKKYMSELLKGRKPSENTRLLMRVNHADVSGKNNPRAMAVVQLSSSGEFLNRFDTVREAAMLLNGNIHARTYISACCKGKKSVYKTFKFMYEVDYRRY